MSEKQISLQMSVILGANVKITTFSLCFYKFLSVYSPLIIHNYLELMCVQKIFPKTFPITFDDS